MLLEFCSSIHDEARKGAFTSGQGQNAQRRVAEWIEASALNQSSFTHSDHTFARLVQCGYLLWNAGVALSHANTSDRQDMLLEDCLTRQAGCDVIRYAWMGKPSHLDGLDVSTSLCSFFIHLSLAWERVGEQGYPMALACLQHAEACMTHLRTHPVSAHDPKTLRLETRMLGTSVLVRTKCSETPPEALLTVLDQAQPFLEHVPEQRVYLCLTVCHECGGWWLERGNHSAALVWYRYAFDLAAKGPVVDASEDHAPVTALSQGTQANTLRTMALCYMSMEAWSKAEEVLEQANEMHLHWKGLVLLIQLSFRQGNHEETRKRLEMVLLHPLTTLQGGLEALRIIPMDAEETWMDMWQHGVSVVQGRFTQHPDAPLILLLQLQYAHAREDGQVEEECLEQCHAVVSSLSQHARRFFDEAWSYGSLCYDAHAFSKAAFWFGHCLLFMDERVDPVFGARIHRAKAHAARRAGQWVEAAEDAEAAATLDPLHPSSQLLCFEVHLGVASEDEPSKPLVQALRRLSEMAHAPDASEEVQLALCSAASMAASFGSMPIFLQALDQVIASHLPSASPERICTLLRVGVGEAGKHKDKDRLHRYVQLFVRMAPECALPEEEVSFVALATWNALVVVTHAPGALYESIHTLLQTIPKNTVRYRLCAFSLTLAATAYVREASWEDAVRVSTAGMDLCEHIHGAAVLPGVETDSDDLAQLRVDMESCIPRLVVAQFVTTNHVDPTAVSATLRGSTQKPGMTALFLETMATDAIEPKVAQEALALALDRLYQEAGAHVEDVSTRVASLHRRKIELSNSKEQARVHFQDALEHADIYNVLECEWFSVKAYNYGVYAARLSQYQDAEAWISLAMKFLQQTTQDVHHKGLLSTMMNGYAEVSALA